MTGWRSSDCMYPHKDGCYLKPDSYLAHEKPFLGYMLYALERQESAVRPFWNHDPALG